MTHDSIGLGEDGPTHQPVEHLAALRAMPNMRVFRPADAIETAECWQLALERIDGPTVIALTRQNLAAGADHAVAANLCATGAYEVSPASGAARRDHLRQRLRGRDRDRRAGASRRARHRRPRRLGALARAVPAPARGRPPRRHRQGADQGRRRGRRPLRLGRRHRPRRRLRRHEQLRRQRPLQGRLQEFRHHRRGGRRRRRQDSTTLDRNLERRP